MNQDRFTIKSQEALRAAIELAAGRRHTESCPSICCSRCSRPPTASSSRCCSKLGARPEAIRGDVNAAIDALPTITGPGAEPTTARELLQVLRAAEHEAGQLQDEYISAEHLLLSLSGHNSKAGEALRAPARRRTASCRRSRRSAAPPRDRPVARGQVPGAREVRPRPHRAPPRRASSTR